MASTFRYIAEFPPAPYVMVKIGSPDGSRESAFVAAKVDSGADRTLVPVSLVENLQIQSCEVGKFAGLGGHIYEFAIYEVLLTIQGLPPIPVLAGATEHESYPLLGRDVLNRYSIHLDGPNQRLTIH